MGDPKNRPAWEVREEEEKLFSKYNTPTENTVAGVVLTVCCIGFLGWVAWILIWPFMVLVLSLLGGCLVGL